MVLFLRALPMLIELALLIYCLIDAIQTPSDEVRNLSKGWWIVLIVVAPLVGGIAWLVAGRPNVHRRNNTWAAGGGSPQYGRPGRPGPGGAGATGSRGRPLAPDDDPEFLAGLSQVNREHEETLRRWEDDLRRREQELRKDDAAGESRGKGPDEIQDDPS